MVLEYMGGGELFHWLKEHRRFSEPRSRLYTAEIGLGLGESPLRRRSSPEKRADTWF